MKESKEISVLKHTAYSIYNFNLTFVTDTGQAGSIFSSRVILQL